MRGMHKRILPIALLALAVGTTPAAARKGGDDKNEVRKAGSCGSGATSKIKVKNDDGRIEAEFEVDRNVDGEKLARALRPRRLRRRPRPADHQHAAAARSPSSARSRTSRAPTASPPAAPAPTASPAPPSRPSPSSRGRGQRDSPFCPRTPSRPAQSETAWTKGTVPRRRGGSARRAGRTRACPCPPSGPRGPCRAPCTACSRSSRSPASCSGLYGRSLPWMTRPQVLLGPVGERVVLDDAAGVVVLDGLRVGARRGLLAADAGDPRVGAGQRALERRDLGVRAAVVGRSSRRGRPRRGCATPKRSSNCAPGGQRLREQDAGVDRDEARLRGHARRRPRPARTPPSGRRSASRAGRRGGAPASARQVVEGR